MRYLTPQGRAATRRAIRNTRDTRAWHEEIAPAVAVSLADLTTDEPAVGPTEFRAVVRCPAIDTGVASP